MEAARRRARVRVGSAVGRTVDAAGHPRQTRTHQEPEGVLPSERRPGCDLAPRSADGRTRARHHCAESLDPCGPRAVAFVPTGQLDSPRWAEVSCFTLWMASWGIGESRRPLGLSANVSGRMRPRAFSFRQRWIEFRVPLLLAWSTRRSPSPVIDALRHTVRVPLVDIRAFMRQPSSNNSMSGRNNSTR